MTKIKKGISVFLPVFNEGGNIKKCILSIKRYLDKRFKDYEILVISDGSTDNTNEVVSKLAKKEKRIKLFVRKYRLGYGAALKAGFTNSSKDLIFYTDADNQFNINDLDKLLPLLGKYDVVSAYRINRQNPIMRLFAADVYNLLIQTLFNLKIKDIDCSFKLYKREVFEIITLKANTGLIDAEVLIKAKKNGFKIKQIGVKHYPRLKGQTVYEMGGKIKFFAFVRPGVIIDIFKEIRALWSDLR